MYKNIERIESQKSKINIIIVGVMPVCLCILNQVFILVNGMNKGYLWFSILYLIPLGFRIIYQRLSNIKAEKFYNKYHDDVVKFITNYLKSKGSLKENTKLLLFLNTTERELGTHNIIITNADVGDIENLKEILFNKFSLDFNIVYK